MDYSQPKPKSSFTNKNNISRWVAHRAALQGVFILLFAAVGVYFLSRSFAATPGSGQLVVKAAAGNFVDGNGSVIQLRGVNRAGTEFACANQNPRAFTMGVSGSSGGTSLDYSFTNIKALYTWDKPGTPPEGPHAINTVRIPLNEECWLGINGAPAAYSGSNYQQYIQNMVDEATRGNLYVVLDLHWAEGGTGFPQGQNIAPNADHSITFWQQVAQRFGTQKGYGNVIFDLFNEPAINCTTANGCPKGNYFVENDWVQRYYRDGSAAMGGAYKYSTEDDAQYYNPRAGQSLNIAGTQQLLNAIRGVGANNIVMVEALGGGSGYIDLLGNYLPKDTLSSPQVAMSFHSYRGYGTDIGNPTSLAATVDYWLRNNKTITGSIDHSRDILGNVPVLVGEYGPLGSCPGTDSNWTANAHKWMDANNISYTAWGWGQNMGCNGPGLVTNNDNGDTFPFGADVKAHLQALQGQKTGATGGGTTPTVTNPSVNITASATNPNAPANFTVTATSSLAANITISTAAGTVQTCNNTATCTFNASNYQAGTYVFTARATTSSGGSGSSTTTVTVAQGTTTNRPPTAAISASTANATAPASVTLTVNASDPDGSVKSVQIYQNGNAVGSSLTAAPYTYTANNLGAGIYNFTAQAVDNANASSAISNTVTVAVAGSTGGSTGTTGTAVTGVKVVAQSSSSVLLTWNPIAGADHYLIKRNNTTDIWAYNTTSYTDVNGITGNNTYTYQILGYTPQGAVVGTAFSNSVSVTTPGTADNQAPNVSGVNLKASASATNKVQLTWGAATDNVGVTAYYIVRSGVTIGQVGGSTLTYDDNSTVASTSYAYNLIAVDAAGNKATSPSVTVKTPDVADTTPPSVPSGVAAKAISISQINVTWNASVDNAGGSGLAGYDVYRNGTKVASVGATTTSFGDTGLTAGTSYSYTIVARDAKGNASAQSAAASASTVTQTAQDTPPSWPSGSSLAIEGPYYNWWQGPCSSSSSCFLNLSWPKAEDDKGVTYYQIWRSQKNDLGSIIATVPATQTSYQDKISADIEYRYSVVARDSASQTTQGPVSTKQVNCYWIFCQ